MICLQRVIPDKQRRTAGKHIAGSVPVSFSLRIGGSVCCMLSKVNQRTDTASGTTTDRCGNRTDKRQGEEKRSDLKKDRVLKKLSHGLQVSQHGLKKP